MCFCCFRSAVYVRQLAKKQKMGDQENVDRTDHSETPDHASIRKSEKVPSDESSQRKAKNELSSLVKSIKMKSNSLKSQAKVPWKPKYKF